ncbi:MAG: type II toxin-antitoxin system HigA family antitoxin [Burkholderiales bacterium]
MAKHNIEIELIKSKSSYLRGLKRVAWFFDNPPKSGSAEETEFELLLMMVDRYESEHHPVPPPDPITAIEFAIDQRGLSTADLQKILGSRQRVHDILKRKRHLSLDHVRKLHEFLGLPAEVLIKAY